MLEIIFNILYIINPETAIDYALMKSNVPVDLHYDYKVVIVCESNFNPSEIGDGGSAIGLLQIHTYPWVDWSIDNGYGYFDLYKPIDNINLAYVIQEKYDLVRNRDRWHQWTMKPNFTSCKQRLIE